MLESEYILEVYEPDSLDDVWVVFSSSSPFMPFRSGEILNPMLWPDSHSPMKVLRIVGVEYLVWEGEGKVKQKVMVFTKELDNSRESRETEYDF